MRPYEPVLGLALSAGNGGLVAERCDFELVGECPVLLFWGWWRGCVGRLRLSVFGATVRGVVFSHYLMHTPSTKEENHE